MDRSDSAAQQSLYYLLIGYALLLILIGFLSAPLTELWQGMKLIFTAPSNLMTDYFKIAGFGSTFINSGILTIASLALTGYKKVELNGPMIAALFTVSGFSFFGKDIFNSIPIYLGVLFYARLVHKPYAQFSLIALFGSTLSPVISYIAFGSGLALTISIPLGYLVGIFIGLVLPPLSAQFLQFHQGFSLYNVGFTSGILAMLIASIMRLSGHEISTPQLISNQYSTSAAIFLLFLSLLLFLCGFFLNHFSFTGMKIITASSGKLVTDFIALTNLGATLINMSSMGLLLITFVYLLGGSFSGPIVGAVLTVMGFSAFGNHWKNSLPILAGVLLAAFLSPAYGSDPFPILLTAIFGTSLAPIAGYYGPVAGVIAGFIHLSLVSNVSYLHGGLNLYNNGFSCGFVAAGLVPILDTIYKLKEDHLDRKRKNTSDR